MTYYRTTVTGVGPEAGDMLAAGVLILYAEPLPDALADVSVVHRPEDRSAALTIGVGDVVSVGGHELSVTAVGEIAAKNLDELGHVVLYVDQPDQKLLPGAVHAAGGVPDPRPGHVIEFRSLR
ncbi:PTS glucitol/sorbitol transporter subunit IIA [Pseudonocardia adelaidensis]|uniref:PTS glucitol/sorbitol transporter subunit IIA n=1 Tax=Pseudonocardia adelaidensis TaxID=648754 RepID=A0ABP9NPA3_9PSEU